MKLCMNHSMYTSDKRVLASFAETRVEQLIVTHIGLENLYTLCPFLSQGMSSGHAFHMTHI